MKRNEMLMDCWTTDSFTRNAGMHSAGITNGNFCSYQIYIEWIPRNRVL